MNTIYIRVDMNPTIATGHVMRCLSIADEIRTLGGSVVFVTADEYPVESIKSRGYEVLILHSDWKKMEDELPQLKKLIDERKIEKILVDTYQVTPAYLQTLREWVKVVYLDDLDAFSYPVDELICYANYYNLFSYGSKKGKAGYYLGMDYVPLRKVFQNYPKKIIEEKVQSILLLSGGTDSYGIIERMVERFKDERAVRFVTICGRFYEGFEELQSRYQEYSNLEFYKNVSNLEDYMKVADMAISAGGITLYELCAVGTPTISYSFVDNQLYNVKQFDADGLIDYAGDVRNADIFENAWDIYAKYKENSSLRKEKSLKMQQQVDGKGANRIAEVLLGNEISK